MEAPSAEPTDGAIRVKTKSKRKKKPIHINLNISIDDFVPPPMPPSYALPLAQGDRGLGAPRAHNPPLELQGYPYDDARADDANALDYSPRNDDRSNGKGGNMINMNDSRDGSNYDEGNDDYGDGARPRDDESEGRVVSPPSDDLDENEGDQSSRRGMGDSYGNKNPGHHRLMATPKKDSSTDPMTPNGRKEMAINTDEIFPGFSAGTGLNSVSLMPLTWGAFDSGPEFLHAYRPNRRAPHHRDSQPPKNDISDEAGRDPMDEELEKLPSIQKTPLVHMVSPAGNIPLRAYITKYNTISSSLVLPTSAPSGSFHQPSEWNPASQQSFLPHIRIPNQTKRSSHQPSHQQTEDTDDADPVTPRTNTHGPDEKEETRPNWLTSRSPKHYFVGRLSAEDSKLPKITSRSNKAPSAHSDGHSRGRRESDYEDDGDDNHSVGYDGDEEENDEEFRKTTQRSDKRNNHTASSKSVSFPPISQHPSRNGIASLSAPASSGLPLGRVAPYKPYNLNDYKKHFKKETAEEKEKRERKEHAEKRKLYAMQFRRSKS